MDIGLLLHTRQIVRQEDAAKNFEQLWADAAQAEALGFDHIWLGDSVTVLEKARGDCLTTMAALAVRIDQDQNRRGADAACAEKSGLISPCAGYSRRHFERPDYPWRQRRTCQGLHSTPICGLWGPAPGKSGTPE